MRSLKVILTALVAIAYSLAVTMVRWDAAGNRYLRGDDVAPAPSLLRSANGDSGWLDSRDYAAMSLLLDVTVVGGDANETLDVIVETRSGAGAARTVGSFAQKTQPGGVTSERKTFAGFDDEYRVRWTLAGTTPTFTFSVTGAAK